MLHMISLQSPQVVELAVGDTLKVVTVFDYRGPRQQLSLYAAIGNEGILGFDEIISSQSPVDLPQSPDEFTTCEEIVDVRITGAISPGIGYDLMAKIKEYPSQTEVRIEDIIDVVEGPTSPLIQMMGMMLPLMMMGMMVSMVTKSTAPEEEAAGELPLEAF